MIRWLATAYEALHASINPRPVRSARLARLWQPSIPRRSIYSSQAFPGYPVLRTPSGVDPPLVDDNYGWDEVVTPTLDPISLELPESTDDEPPKLSRSGSPTPRSLEDRPARVASTDAPESSTEDEPPMLSRSGSPAPRPL